MRIMYKRNCTNYLFSAAIFSFLISLYILGLRQSKQIGTGFNLKPIKVKEESSVDLALETKIQQRSYIDINRAKRESAGAALQQNNKEATPVAVKASTNGVKAISQEDWTPVDVYIVDEHHDVIPHWFAAAKKGVIPRSGNTLVHIDAHADLAQPYYIPGYPFFKWPGDKQLKYLMQTNDAFIQAAGIAGLVNRVIWVWPDWDSPNHEAQYVMSTLSLGWVAVKSPDKRSQKTQKAFCLCQKNETSVDCRSLINLDGDYNANRTEGGFVIPRHKCNILRILIIEEIHENKAISFLSKSEWIAPSESIIVDIDEDYHGCSYAIEPTLSANLSFERVKHLDDLIKAQFCPISTEHERMTDMFLVDLISLLRIQRACKIDKTLTNTTKCRLASKINTVKHFENKLSSTLGNKTIRICFHANENTVVKMLTSELSKLRIKQLRALQIVGFCSNTSPKTLDLYDNRKFGVCYGANTPAQTAIYEHTPTSSEIVARSIVLKGLLRKLKQYSPRLVTLARSVRDGYTPRQFFEKIEDSIISGLESTMDIRLHYDRDLLGGKPGWPARHKV